MRTALKAFAAFVAVACLVWIGVLWRWRSTQHDFDDGDVVLYLFLLPVAVFALAWAARRAVGRALLAQDAKAAEAASAAAVATASTGEVASPASDEGGPATWHLWSAAIRTAAGDTVDALLAATQAGDPRPRPDPELLDDDGLPILTARIADLDTAAVDSELQRDAADVAAARDDPAQRHAWMPELPPRAVRALAILSPLIDDLAVSIEAWVRQWEDAASRASGAPVGSHASPGAAAGVDKLVRVLAAWPVDWDDATCAAAQHWLTRRLTPPHAGARPPARCSVQAQRMAGSELLAAAARILAALQRDGRDDPLVLLACHSDLDTSAIEALERQQRLFHATRRPRVAMAGEGAAVMVVSAVAWPADARGEPEGVRFSNPVLARRPQSIEAAGRTVTEDTVALARRGLAAAGLSGDAVATLASDADQHTPRATELFAVTLALTPDLDANEDVRLVGTLTGRLEAVAPLVCLACAAAQARHSGRPALALSLGDVHWRAVAVLCPESFWAAPAMSPA